MERAAPSRTELHRAPHRRTDATESADGSPVGHLLEAKAYPSSFALDKANLLMEAVRGGCRVTGIPTAISHEFPPASTQL